MTYTVSTMNQNNQWYHEDFAEHDAARVAYNRAVASRVYKQVHIKGGEYLGRAASELSSRQIRAVRRKRKP